MKTEMMDTNKELNLNELEQVNGGMLLAGLLIGALVTGTVALFGVAALSDQEKNDG
ncbi:MAG: class IIb bacteriocin, lactobin A/cerein 7B family [Clostridia bacterium]|nr:class IIb bacteriocin, lactobin A/cerein 7B family [Clostridia bacterium]